MGQRASLGTLRGVRWQQPCVIPPVFLIQVLHRDVALHHLEAVRVDDDGHLGRRCAQAQRTLQSLLLVIGTFAAPFG